MHIFHIPAYTDNYIWVIKKGNNVSLIDPGDSKPVLEVLDNNEFILLEGDEYLSSPIDSRPKFHHYEPQIALISGIAWDHVNVFKTQVDYNHQFKIFIVKIYMLNRFKKSIYIFLSIINWGYY